MITWLVTTHIANAATYEALYAFGDSYSDIGARYVDGNGLTAVAYLAQHMGIEMSFPHDTDFHGKSLDFAASGAPSGTEGPLTVHGVRWCCQGMLDQVKDFASRVRTGSLSFDSRSTLFFIAGGLNDRELATAITVENLTQQISRLKEVGAFHVRLCLLPREIPDFAVVAERLNPVYRRLVPGLRSRLRIDLRLSYWGPYFDEVIRHPGRYGITNTTSKCAGRSLFGENEAPCATPDAYFYYHEGHPSTAVHRIVGAKLYREIIAEPLAHQ